MGLIKDKVKEQIDASQSQKFGDTIGLITKYNHLKNTASIIFNNPSGGGSLTADNVAIKISEGGTSTSGPAERQKCIISFLGNNLLTPIITGLCNDEYYQEVYSQKSSSDAGAFLIDQEIFNVDTSREIKPMISDWTDPNNKDVEKYTSTNKDYKNIDASEMVMFILAEVDKYTAKEDGITNTYTKATIKCKENGDIDIFVNNNTGVRVSPANKSVSFFGTNLNASMKNWTINVDEFIINGNLKVNGKITEVK